MSPTSCGTFCPDVFSKIRIFYEDVLVLLFFVARDVIVFIVFVAIIRRRLRSRSRDAREAPGRGPGSIRMVHGEASKHASLIFYVESFCLGRLFVATL